MFRVLFDHARAARIGLPEAVLCQGKSRRVIEDLLEALGTPGMESLLLTRLEAEVFFSLPPRLRARVDYHELSRTAFAGPGAGRGSGNVAVVSAGTADGGVAWEAARTLEYLGIRHTLYEDSGVAGLWRLAGRLEDINAAQAVIVVAGMDAALASVLGGLTPKPLFAVPTSVGYGAARQGETALACMLASCAPGVAVLNIDNGYGAACAAARVVRLL
ncbi:MAG: nickel pincer cofactor biosynthesis protein LarB [Desulfovibrio sp.]|nr:nickel pincer cofactor biosynthesis protein LarB [Desulfovibrio sp.]